MDKTRGRHRCFILVCARRIFQKTRPRFQQAPFARVSPRLRELPNDRFYRFLAAVSLRAAGAFAALAGAAAAVWLPCRAACRRARVSLAAFSFLAGGCVGFPGGAAATAFSFPPSFFLDL